MDKLHVGKRPRGRHRSIYRIEEMHGVMYVYSQDCYVQYIYSLKYIYTEYI